MKNSLLNHEQQPGKMELRDSNLCSVKIFRELFNEYFNVNVKINALKIFIIPRHSRK